MINKDFGKNIDFGEMPPQFFLIGLLSEFNNRLQATADTFFEEISWKQCFLLNCITFFEEPPTIKELAELVGCSHQNTKRLLLKLEKMGFVNILQDDMDRRKQRIVITEKTKAYREKYNQPSIEFMAELFKDIDFEELETTIKVITQLDAKLKTI